MAKGIIYVMTTVVPGLIKIGKTGTENFESRMYYLERNGYRNITGLKRKFAIEVDDYHDKEKLLDTIFSKSNVPNTELFALDVGEVIRLLSSFEGREVYPKDKTKKEVFEESVKEQEVNLDKGLVPDGTYSLVRNVRGFGNTRGTAIVKDGIFKVLKGSICGPIKGSRIPEERKNALIENNILQEDIICRSPSTAGFVVIGASNNGWVEWKNKDGQPIDFFRSSEIED